MKGNSRVRLGALMLAAGCVLSSIHSEAKAQSNSSGSVYGVAPATDRNAKVTVKSTETGYTQDSAINRDGTFRLGSLPVGDYVVTYTADGVEPQTQSVSIGIGENAQVRFSSSKAVELQGVVVRGISVPAVDTTSVESATNFTAKQLAALPVARGTSAVQLLAPDAVAGDAAFSTQGGQPLVSFGGSSPLENAYFLNGFNITDFRKGRGGSEVPFEFYKDIQVKTGGYSAEYGRSLGGVVNIVSQTGTNKFDFGADTFWEPSWAYSRSPSSQYVSSQSGNAGTTLKYRDNGDDYRNTAQGNAYVSGPIIKDRLFFYGVISENYNKQDDIRTFGDKYYSATTTYPNYAANLTGIIAKGHKVDLTMFSDEKKFTTTTYNTTYDPGTGLGSSERTQANSVNTFHTGGKNYIAHYSGQFTDWFTVSALYGHGYFLDQSANDYVQVGGGPCPSTTDIRSGATQVLGCAPFSPDNGLPERNYKDTRDAYRLDGIFTFSLLGEHSLKVGYDRENLSSEAFSTSSPTESVRRCTPTPPATTCTAGTATVNSGDDFVRVRAITQNGKFDNNLEAYYVEDNWQVIPRLLLVYGLRVDTFDLKGANGDSFVKSKDLYGPRVGAAFDVFDNGKAKAYANWGRYYIPIETNTAYRNTAVGSDLTSYYQLGGVDPQTGAVTLGAQISPPAGQILTGAPTPQSTDLDSTSQDEYILGYQQEIAPKWSAGVKGTYRHLRKALEDSCNFDPTLTNYGCFLWNPGYTIAGVDYTGDGVIDPPVQGSALGFPKAKREYYGLELNVERVYDRKWFFKATYTYSHSYGNFEGYSNSEIGQDDAGITIDFDFAPLTTNTYGDLPNDRRHKFKVNGAYNLTPDLVASINYSLISGRPVNRLGDIPNPNNDPLIAQVNSFYSGSAFEQPRGTVGHTAWVDQVNLGLRYQPSKLLKRKVTFGLDVFNIFNNHAPLSVVEQYETTDQKTDYYGQPDSYQTPRYIRLSAGYAFR